MTHRRELAAVAAVALLAVAIVFALGAAIRLAGRDGFQAPILTGDGYVGDDVATFQVGDTTYGFRSSVAWTDAAGSEHSGGWPACLSKLTAVTGVRFAGAVVWHANVGNAEVVWVDCRSR